MDVCNLIKFSIDNIYFIKGLGIYFLLNSTKKLKKEFITEKNLDIFL